MKARPPSGIAVLACLAAAGLAAAASAALALPPPPASAPTGSVAPAPAGAGRPAPGTPAAPTSASGGGIGFTPAGGNSNAPIDITADNVEMFQPQHLTIYKGNVEVNQDTTRMRTPELRIYSRPKAAPGAAPAPVPTGKGGPTLLDGQNSSIDHMEAAGPFYYMTPTQNARSDYMRYEADPDTITLTGNVVLVQGKDVATGDRLVIDRKTGHNQLFKDAGGRVRTILHPNSQKPGQPPQATPPAPAR